MLVARQKLQHNFSRAAGEYDARAQFQQVQTRRVLDAALMVFPHIATIVDIGCGTGYFSAEAKNKRPNWNMIGIDIAQGMCEIATSRCTAITGDAWQLPLTEDSVDAVVSSLCYQWVENHDAAFSELARVLKPGGRAVIATLGVSTLHELRSSADAVSLPLNLLAMRDFVETKATLTRSGLAITLADCTRETRYYPSVLALIDSMRAIGAGNNFVKNSCDDSPALQKFNGIITPKRWVSLVAEYEKLRTAQGIPATWEHHFFVLHKPL